MTELDGQSVVDERYRIVRKVGSGGMADVYCAEDTHLERMVALKLLYRRFSQDREFVERFRREASAAAALQHPNVVSVYDRGEFDGTYYIAMEFCEGPSLKDVIAREGPLPPRRAISIAKQVLLAARFAHRRGVIHRDLKPQNVILAEGDRVKVADFGIARAGASEITEAGAIMGTAQYLSPEQAQGEAVTEASDLYSIGVVLFEMVTGRVPFDGDTAVAVALKHVSESPPSPREFLPEIVPELEAVVMKALAKEPDERYTDADSFIHDLEAVEARLDQDKSFDTEQTAMFAPVVVPVAEAAADSGAPSAATPETDADVSPDAEAEVAAGDGAAASEAERAPESPEQRRRRRWLWAAGILGIAAVLLGGYLLLKVDQVPVPSVLGQTLDSAREELEDAGFEIDIKRRGDPAPVDTVIDQVPAPAAGAPEGSTVTITVSNGPSTVRVPDVVGLSEEDAVKRMKRAGLKPAVERESSTEVAEGSVVRSDPGSGVSIERGSSVTLLVSSGSEEVEVPSVIGQGESDAVAQLREEGLNVVVREKASSEPTGTVVKQSPVAGQKVDEGSSVTIQVSDGKLEEVPDVTGLDQADAEERLDDAGFKVSVRSKSTSRPGRDGKVMSQSPSAGSEHRKGSTVTITVGALTPPETGVLP